MRAIFERDFLSFAKRKRFFALRTLVVSIPLLLFLTIAIALHDKPADEVGVAVFAATMFPLLAIAVFITPGMLAHVLTDERRNNKLDVLRSSPISATGIVLGKWLSRLALVWAIIFAALPMSAAALLFGGVSPEQFLAGSSIILLTVLWVSSLTIFVSACNRDLAVATRVAYTTVVLVLVGSIIVWIMLLSLSFRGNTQISAWEKVLLFLVGINPIVLMGGLMAGVPNALAMIGINHSPLLVYTLCSLGTSALFVYGSISVVRRDPAPKGSKKKDTPTVATLGQLGTSNRNDSASLRVAVRKNKGRYSRRLAILARQPVLWLEICRGAGRQRRVWLTIASIATPLIIEAIFFYSLSEVQAGSEEETFVHVFPIMAYLTIGYLSVASLGAGVFHRDNEAKTLEVLHSAPLTTTTLAQGKMLGALRAASVWWILSVCHAVLAVVIGHHPMGTGLVYTVVSAVLFASLGAFAMVMGLKSKTLVKATLKTMGGFIGLVAIYPMVFGIMGAFLDMSDKDAVVLFGQNPYFLTMIPFIAAEDARFLEHLDRWPMCVAYFGVYAVFAIFAFARVIPALYEKKRGENWEL